MKLDFTGRHVVVTGGTGALGAAVVGLLVDAGATCHIPAHSAPDPQRLPVAGNDRVRVVAGVDLTDEAAVTTFYGGLPSLWASIHVAGGFAASPIADTPLSQFDQMMSANATTCFLCCREAVRKIRAGGGGKDGGRIVNVASKPAVIPSAGLATYAASKAAVVSLTLTLSEELAGERIWVNAVAPSTMDTPANRKGMPKADFSKWPKVEDVAATIAFLASPQNAVTRGAIAPVYGQS
jgi:NAD(P)-dependent dehydrogenase (short-subunit alcohol dehydrogenase family)